MGFIKTVIKKTLIQSFFAYMRRSYSQSGEDIIISDLFRRLKIDTPTYLDIGANEPVALSNTYRLYSMRSKGVCVEPNPILYKKLLKKRKRDICINAGVAFNQTNEALYYIFPEKLHGLNTFSKTDADFWGKKGNLEIGKAKIEKTIMMPLVNINDIIKKYLFPHPNLISIDVEGLDLEILKTIDFELFKPDVFCVETLKHIENNKETKNNDLINFLKDMGYFIYADTYINTIFCRKDIYKALL